MLVRPVDGEAASHPASRARVSARTAKFWGHALTRLEHHMCRHRADVGGFVVATRAQGTGLARKIVLAAEDKARTWGCTILEISCRGGTHAEDAYVGLGFIRRGRLPGGYHDRDGQVFDEVGLWRPIPAT